MDFHARQYDPQLGRFLGIDSLGTDGGQDMFSPYAAMGNAPENIVDPNGTSLMAAKDFNDVRDQRSGFAAAAIKFVDAFGKIWGGSGGEIRSLLNAMASAAAIQKALDQKKTQEAAKQIGMQVAFVANAGMNFTPRDGRKKGRGHAADPLTSELEVPKEKRTNDDMHLSADGYALLANYEAPRPGKKGFKNGKYTIMDVGDGKMTIGLGYVVTTAAEAKEFANGITPEKAISLMLGKVSGFEEIVKRLINTQLSQFEFDALVLFTYQSGTIYNDLTNAINRRQSLNIIEPIWISHDISGGEHNPGVKNRRQDEFELFSSGDYQRNH